MRVSGFDKVYETVERDAVRALAGIDFDVRKGEFHVSWAPRGAARAQRCDEEKVAILGGNAEKVFSRFTP